MNRTIEDFIGETPLVRVQRLQGKGSSNVILAKLEGNNPAGSVKDRPAMSMIRGAEKRRQIKPGDTLIEPTSGNTGIALAMAAAIRGYRMVLIMPEHLSVERRQTMRAFGAEIVLTPQKGGMEAARDLAEKMVREKKGIMLDQFANPDNPLVHYETTGPEIWRDTQGKITHFVSSMGTTGTIMGCSRFFKEKNPDIEVIGCQPEEGSQIPGIRKWPEAYLPKIYERARVDRLEYVSQADAEEMTRRMAREEGIFAGISSGGAMHVALRISEKLRNAVIVTVVACYGSSEPLATDTGVRILVSRGPINPVETPDMTTNVAPVAGARVVVRPAEEGDEHEATTDADGLARVALAPGSYTIRVVECPGAMSLPKEDASVTVREGAFASAELVCDTGIR